jgi:hypothetical protein
MLAFVYLILFLALSAALTWWRVSSYERRHRLLPLASRAVTRDRRRR